MEKWIEIKIRLDENYQELVIAELYDIAFQGFEQTISGLTAWIPKKEWSKEIERQVKDVITYYDKRASLESIVELEPQNYNETWEKSIVPIEVYPFYIKPTWRKDRCPNGFIKILLDPKMAFGTGYHETTRLILRELKTFVSAKDEVLDVGTGTGILGIAALKLGASRVFGFDIDEWSKINAEENAKLNGVSDLYQVKEGSFEVVPDMFYDLVLANVNRVAIIEMAQSIFSHVKEGGHVIFSGILNSETDMIKNDTTIFEHKLISETQEGEWICLVYQKKK